MQRVRYGVVGRRESRYMRLPRSRQGTSRHPPSVEAYGGLPRWYRRRSRTALTLRNGRHLPRIACGSSIRAIAKGLDRAASTVSREVARHGGRPQYRASEADYRRGNRTCDPKLAFWLLTPRSGRSLRVN